VRLATKPGLNESELGLSHVDSYEAGREFGPAIVRLLNQSHLYHLRQAASEHRPRCPCEYRVGEPAIRPKMIEHPWKAWRHFIAERSFGKFAKELRHARAQDVFLASEVFVEGGSSSAGTRCNLTDADIFKAAREHELGHGVHERNAGLFHPNVMDLAHLW
jgi:hypothetical protein